MSIREGVCTLLGKIKGRRVFKTCNVNTQGTTFNIMIHPLTGIKCSKNSFWDLKGNFKMGYRIDGTPLTPISNHGVLFLGENSRLETFANVQIGPSTRLHLAKNSEVSIGANTYAMYDVTILAAHRIEIGSDCAISWDVTITDEDWHSVKYSEKKEKKKGLTIGDHVWICHNVSILKGVTIGNNCVIGAGSVVCRDLPDNCLAVGVPAKPVRHEVTWEK